MAECKLCYVVRLETRGKEFISVARITKGILSESENPAACKGIGYESARSHRDNTRNRSI
jgi:hypothetical protein